MIAFWFPQGWQLIIVLLIILLLFGHRLPGLARSLGSGITEFKKGLKDGDDKEKLPPPAPGSPEKKENQATS